jgi:predicted dehydrogenase
VEDVNRITAAAEAAQKSVCVNHSLLFDRFVSKALSLVRSGAIGVPLSFDYFRSSEYPPYRGGTLPVHYRNGGYPFLDQGVHAVYLAESFLGPIQDMKTYHGTYGGDPNLLFDEWRVAAQCQRGTANIRYLGTCAPFRAGSSSKAKECSVRTFAVWVTHSSRLRRNTGTRCSN